MIKVKIFCDTCDKWFTYEYKMLSDIDKKCPICKSDKIWFGDIISDEDNDTEIKLGKGGALHA